MTPSRAPLSCYVLTYNSQERLAEVLMAVASLCEDLVVVDSGSTDATESIARGFTSSFHVRTFDDFPSQRAFAQSRCAHDWILTIDSDEVADEALVIEIAALASRSFGESDGIDSYLLRRKWYVRGRQVHSIYPVDCPDRVLRLYRKTRADFGPSNLVHEFVSGFRRTEVVTRGFLHHYTFETADEISKKLALYTSLGARDMFRRGKRASRSKAAAHALAAFLKYYVLKRGFLDGRTGFRLGLYAVRYTWLKYIKLMELARRPSALSR